MDSVVNLSVCEARVRRWAELATQASPIRQLDIYPTGEEAGTAVLEGVDGQVVARELTWVDGAFYLEARQAVIYLADLVGLMREYQAYVEDYAANGYFPSTFEDWCVSQKDGAQ